MTGLLPASGCLPVRHLAACFDNTTNSYKYYWFLALLDHVQEERTPVVDVEALLLRMLASVWFPVNRFRLSFGRQDRLRELARKLGEQATLPATATRVDIEAELVHGCCNGKGRFGDLGRYVPTRFLTPWFSELLRGIKDQHKDGEIRRLATERFDEGPCLYRFLEGRNQIEVHPRWLLYLMEHLEILRRFCMWSLVCYLQDRNVNIPNIGAKLMSPVQRDLKPARDFWRPIVAEHPEMRCIYSDAPLSEVDFAVDHFVPWSFVTHDQLWNLCPIPTRVNSSKGDALPSLSRYFEPFVRMQQVAVRAVRQQPRSRLAEDYVMLFRKDPEAICAMEGLEFRRRLEERIVPLVQVASNVGFPVDWCYRVTGSGILNPGGLL